jgi:uncharacterized protein YjdB
MALLLTATAGAQTVTETFDQLSAPATNYGYGDFVSANGNPWNYFVTKRVENGITGPSAELRKLTGKVTLEVPNGIASLTFEHLEVDDLFKSIIEVSFDGGTPIRFETANESGVVTISIPVLEFTNTTTVTIANLGNQAILLDNVVYEEYNVVVPVTGVSLAERTTTIPVGQSKLLSATVAPTNASDPFVNWQSSDASVATVDPFGLVIARARGTATVTATTADGGFTAATTVTVPAAAPAFRETFNQLDLPVDGPLATGGFTGENGETWSYAAARRVAGEIEGYSIELDRNGRGQLTTTIPGGLSELSFQLRTVDFGGNTTGQVSVTVNGQDYGNFRTVRSEQVVDYTIAGIDIADPATVIFQGTGSLETLLDNVSWTAPGTTTEIKVQSVSLNQTRAELGIGASLQLTATVTPEDATDPTVVWSTSDETIAEVSESGLITAVAEGTVAIVATTVDGGFTATCSVTVEAAVETDPFAESFLRLDAPVGTLAEGSYVGDNGQSWTYERSATVLNGISGQSIEMRKLNSSLTTTIPVAFDSLEFSIRTLDGGRDRSGGVQIIVGTDTLGSYGTTVSERVETFLIEGIGADAGAVLKINGVGFDNTILDDVRWGNFPPLVPVTSVSIDQTLDTLMEGESFQFSATILPLDATEAGINWSTTTPALVGIDQQGRVEAERPGTATIVVTTDDGALTDTLTFVVKELIVPDDLAIDADGWSVFAPGPDSRVIYCSDSEGDDANDGLSQATPVQTLDRAFSLVRDGSPDHVYLKRGDTWLDQDFMGLRDKSGKNSFERMVVAYYGQGDRPLIKLNNQIILNDAIDNAAIIGIEFYNYPANPDDPDFRDLGENNLQPGFRLVAQVMSNVLIEDCKISYFGYLITMFNKAYTDVTGAADAYTNFDIRRNILTNAYQLGATDAKIKSQGMFISHATDFLFEENFMDHNGWNEVLPTAQPNQYNHNLYMSVDNDGPIVVRNNIISRGAAHGVQLRSGGTATGNAFIGNAIGMNMGYSTKPTYNEEATVVAHNVVTNGRPQIPGDNTNPQTGALWGLWRQLIDKLTIDSNIVANVDYTATGNVKPYNGMTANELGAGNIAWNWKQNDEPTTDPGWLDPTRDKDSYAASLGYADYDDWVAAASNRPLRTFPAEFSAASYVDYIREGFSLVEGPDLTVGDCAFAEADFFGAAEITAVGAITYADFSFRRGSYVVGIGTGIRDDGLAGAWEIHDDCTIETIRRTGQGDRITRLPDVRGVERNRGWRYLPISISADGQYIYGTAVNENGFTHSRGWTIAAGTTVDVRWKLGGPFYGRIFGIRGSIVCDDLNVITYAGNYFVTGCNDGASSMASGARTQVQSLSREETKLSYSVFPNPVNRTSVTVRTDEPAETIRLIGLNGRVLRHLVRPGYTAELDLRQVASGVYIVEITGSEETVRTKLIVN